MCYQLSLVRSITPMFMLTAALAGPVIAQPPAAPVREVVDIYHGVEVSDFYRYMEDIEDPEVQAWIRAQSDYAHKVLSSIPGRDAVLARLEELDAGKPFVTRFRTRMRDGSMFYMKRLSSETLMKLCFRSASGEERILVDPEALSAGEEQHYSLGFYSPSDDGRYVAFGLAQGGSEQYDLQIMEVASGKLLDDRIERLEPYYLNPKWHPDGHGIFYSQLVELGPDDPATEGYKNSKTFFHRLGDDPANDRLILAVGTSPVARISELDFPATNITHGSEYAVAQIKHGDANELTLFTAHIDELVEDPIPWKKICDVQDEVTRYAVHGNEIYLMTAKDAPRFQVVRTSLENPDLATAKVVIPKGELVVEEIYCAEDALYAGIVDAAFNRVVRVPYQDDSATETLEVPSGMAGFIVSTDPEIDGALIYAVGWTKGAIIYEYDPATGEFHDSGLMPAGKYDDVPGFESHEVMVKSHDGVKVPMSILHKSDIELDGTNSTWLVGYGSYGFNYPVFFSEIVLAWLEKGGVFAVTHVRGGGAFGKEWHLAGQKLNKPNTWKDFIACAEYLIKNGYTSPGRVAGQGGSAGGILIGRAITERPDLFAAAIIDVGDCDMLRIELTTNGVPNIPEFGTVTDEDGFKGLYEMSALHHVEDGVSYPAVLLTHGMNDPRVEPWTSTKMTARLQAATSSHRPVLLRVDYDEGHGIGSTREQYLKRYADKIAFLLWQFGVDGFQPGS